MRPRALRVALTGGIASGKSHCLRCFQSHGAPVIDADTLAHDVVAPGSPGAEAIMQRFGTLDRAALGAVVFHDARARADLEAIVHPLVYDRWFRGLSDAPYGIADIPLLFETNRARDFDRVILTSCRPEQQRARLLARGLSVEDADVRIASQLPFDEKLRRGRDAGIDLDVIDTSGAPAESDAQVDRLSERLGSLPPRACS